MQKVDDYIQPDEFSQDDDNQQVSEEVKTYKEPVQEQTAPEPSPMEETKIAPAETSNSILDAELEALLSKQKAKIKVVGCGGGGNNTVNRITEVGIEGAETIAINTDAQDLLYTTADKKLLIGKEITQGLGAGSNPKIGEESAKESEMELKKLLIGGDLIFITCG